MTFREYQDFELLGSLVQTQKGFAFKSEWYSEKGTPIVKVSNFTEDSVDVSDLTFIPDEIAVDYLKYRLLKDDVVIQTVGSWPTNPQSVVGKVVKIPMQASGALLNQNNAKLIPNHRLDKQFLFYLLKSKSFKEFIVGCAQGAASQASITLDDIRRFSFWLPPLPTQRKIAALLSAYDDLIENNTRRIKILEEMAQSLYREWFVNFRFPDHEQVALVNSPLGPIPKGWEISVLADAFVLQRGFDLPLPQRRTGSVPVFAATGINGYHDEAKAKGPGVVTGRSGSLGVVTFIDRDYWPLNTTLWVKEFRKVTPLYTFYLLSSLDLRGFNSGAAVPTLNRNDVHKIPVVIPPWSLLNQFDSYILPMYKLKNNLSEKIANLRRTRDLLLPRLVSGELDVSTLDVHLSTSL